ncbi:cyclase [Halobacteriales archaeon QH_10_67_13]|nr:MAG: cyclase [Halobacteriales archaeon QH_10_67_13]
MPRYERTSRIEAPFEAVWEFHAGPEGLLALTPAIANLEIEAVHAADSRTFEEELPEVRKAGARLVGSVRPFGIGPRQRFVSEIVARERENNRGYFRDVLQEGPLARWVHTHRFAADGERTILTDSVRYELPQEWTSPLVKPGLAIAFADRHRRTRARLAGEAADAGRK